MIGVLKRRKKRKKKKKKGKKKEKKRRNVRACVHSSVAWAVQARQ
jgi:hypothetical protein